MRGVAESAGTRLLAYGSIDGLARHFYAKHRSYESFRTWGIRAYYGYSGGHTGLWRSTHGKYRHWHSDSHGCRDIHDYLDQAITWFCVNLGAKALSISDENATMCHSDDRREEESEHINVDVFRFFANDLNDNRFEEIMQRHYHGL